MIDPRRREPGDDDAPPSRDQEDIDEDEREAASGMKPLGEVLEDIRAELEQRRAADSGARRKLFTAVLNRSS